MEVPETLQLQAVARICGYLREMDCHGLELSLVLALDFQ